MASIPLDGTDDDVDVFLPLVTFDSEGSLSKAALPPSPPNRNVVNLIAQLRMRGTDFHNESQGILSALLQELQALEILYDALIARRARIKAEVEKENSKVRVLAAVLRFIDEGDARI